MIKFIIDEDAPAISFKKNGKPRVRFYVDYVGKKFGNLEVVCKDGYRGKNPLWKCYCHACGSTKSVAASQLRSYTKSCGCQRTLRDWKSPGWKGVGEIPRTMLTGYKNNAKRRKIFYDLDDQYIWDIYLKQDRKCALSGLPIKFGRNCQKMERKITASLDRIESSKPYVEGNVQWVHKHINAMKLNHSDQYFIDLCRKVVEYNSK